ncbi:MAG: VWA domain-containing protein [Pyrinomonadaceae bacterium]
MGDIMIPPALFRGSRFPALLLCLAIASGQPATAQQQPTQRPPEPADDVVRVETELVQTDVMVFDSQGRFVDGLKPEQFVLKVDGKPQSVQFFERVRAGSVDEEGQLAAARGGARRPAREGAGVIKPLDRGRAFFFFVDDLHLTHGSLKRARETLLHFVENEMSQNDEAAVNTTTGQLGFLQQLTDEKAVLRAAVDKLRSSRTNVFDSEQPRMSAHQAQAVDRNDLDVMAAYVERILRENPRMSRDVAESMVKSRARGILQQASSVSTATLASLENLVRTTARLPGRKVLFFLSEGFLLDSSIGDTFNRLRRITDAAARAGVVIYTIDAQGLATGAPDASMDIAFDPTGRVSSSLSGELAAQQAPLYTLALDTGGRVLVNTNRVEQALTKVVQESSAYYLLAWQPETVSPTGEGRKKARLRRIEVSVAGRTDLRVQVRRGLFDAPLPPPEQKSKGDKKPSQATKPPANRIFEALRAPYPVTTLPLALSINFEKTAEAGVVLSSTVNVSLPPQAPPAVATDAGGGSAVPDSNSASASTERLELAGALFDDKAKLISSFQKVLTFRPPAAGARADDLNLIYTHQTPKVIPGIYQMRVAARDLQTGQVGSVLQWVEIPDLTKGALALSSIFIGERSPAAAADGAEASAAQPPEQIVICADRRLDRNAWLRFLFSIYNAARPSPQSPPDVAMQLQLFRDDQPVVTTPLRRVNVADQSDFSQVPYAGELSLNGLPAGRYLLKVSVIDSFAKSSSSRQLKFTIE